jgi:hypothetical protein
VAKSSRIPSRLATLPLAIVVVLLTGLATAAWGEEWNWYFAFFSSPTSGSEAIINWGVAEVKISDGAFHASFYEAEGGHRYERGTAWGSIYRNNTILGSLERFFPDYHGRAEPGSFVDEVSGLYLTKVFQNGARTCVSETLILQLGESEIIVLRRPLDACYGQQ